MDPLGNRQTPKRKKNILIIPQNETKSTESTEQVLHVWSSGNRIDLKDLDVSKSQRAQKGDLMLEQNNPAWENLWLSNKS